MYFNEHVAPLYQLFRDALCNFSQRNSVTSRYIVFDSELNNNENDINTGKNRSK